MAGITYNSMKKNVYNRYNRVIKVEDPGGFRERPILDTNIKLGI